MKNLLKLNLVMLLLVSCSESPESSGLSTSKNLEGSIREVMVKNVNTDEKYALLTQELGTKTSLTNDQLTEAFPKKLSNLSLDASEDNKVEPKIIGSQIVAGSFGDDQVRMEILDAADLKAIGAIIPLKMLEINKITFEYNNIIIYSNKVRNGILTFGTDRDENSKADFQSELRFLYDNRFYVTLEGKDMDSDALWNAMGIDNLSRFKELNK